MLFSSKCHDFPSTFLHGVLSSTTAFFSVGVVHTSSRLEETLHFISMGWGRGHENSCLLPARVWAVDKVHSRSRVPGSNPRLLGVASDCFSFICNSSIKGRRERGLKTKPNKNRSQVAKFVSELPGSFEALGGVLLCSSSENAICKSPAT